MLIAGCIYAHSRMYICSKQDVQMLIAGCTYAHGRMCVNRRCRALLRVLNACITRRAASDAF